MRLKNFYAQIVEQFASQPFVTLATGVTCAFLGDERSIREHLVSDEAARHLRNDGHTVVHFLVDDNLDPLNFRQLRVAFNKDEELIKRHESWCGRPVAYLPDPWGCCESYAAHFEGQLLNRLHHVNCHPTLIRVSKLYERGLYAPAVRIVLENPEKIRAFLQDRFPQYTPEKLFWPICSTCGYIDSTTVKRVHGEDVEVFCSRCEQMSVQPLGSISGKLNWKLDCAARWPLFHIDAEAFAQPFMEPHVGSFLIAQALSMEFFGGHTVFPLNYGLVKMETRMGGKLIDSLPPRLLRNIFIDHPVSDLNLSRDFMVTVASRHEVFPELTYLDFVKQILPIWLLKPLDLTWNQLEMVKQGVLFGKEFLQTSIQPHLPERQHIEASEIEILHNLHLLLQKSIAAREQHGLIPAESALGDSESVVGLLTQLKGYIAEIEGSKKATLLRFRAIVGQEQGAPVARLLLLLPLDYLNLLLYMIELFLKSPTSSEANTKNEPLSLNGATEEALLPSEAIAAQ